MAFFEISNNWVYGADPVSSDTLGQWCM